MIWTGLFLVLILMAPEVFATVSGDACSTGPGLEAIQKRQLEAGYSPDRVTQWYRAKASAAKAVVVHGLNFNPEKMSALIDELRRLGIDSLRITLSGHGNSKKEFEQATANRWTQEVRDSYCIAHQEAKLENHPVYFIGYSLGAVTGIAAAQQFQEVRPDRAILLAPALRLTFLARTVRWLFWWDSLVLPSRNHQEFTAHRGTPISAYRALFEIIERVNAIKPQSDSLSFPALIVVDPQDELVDSKELRSKIRELQLNHWMWREIKIPDHQKSGAPHHAIMHPFFTGDTAWKTLTQSIQEFLTQKD